MRKSTEILKNNNKLPAKTLPFPKNSIESLKSIFHYSVSCLPFSVYSVVSYSIISFISTYILAILTTTVCSLPDFTFNFTVEQVLDETLIVFKNIYKQFYVIYVFHHSFVNLNENLFFFTVYECKAGSSFNFSYCSLSCLFCHFSANFHSIRSFTNPTIVGKKGYFTRFLFYLFAHSTFYLYFSSTIIL